MCDSVLRWFVKLPVAACVAGGALWMGVACHTAQAEDTQDVTGSELFRVMKTEKDALEKKLQDARVQVRQQQEQVSQLQSMNKELTGTIEALRGQLDDARRDVGAVQATLKAAEADEQKGLAALQQERERSRQLADVIKELRGLVAAQAEAVDAQKRQSC